MPWIPCKRIVCAGESPSLKMRGLSSLAVKSWPDAFLIAAADYSIDFGCVLCSSERIVRATVQSETATLFWVTIYGNIVTIWASWGLVGTNTATVSVVTDSGQVYADTVSITVNSTVPGIAATPSQYPPNAFFLSSSVFVQDSTQAQPLVLG